MDYNQELRLTLQDFRRQALTQFIHEFMRILISEGYTFEDLLDAITSWVALNPELEDVVRANASYLSIKTKKDFKMTIDNCTN
ncbi:MAG: hypothetical protein RMZ69_26060 [Nostoc sp. ChiQUE01a]|nr:hypothetical protein [Nostoc sp. ChiQUE01a]